MDVQWKEAAEALPFGVVRGAIDAHVTVTPPEYLGADPVMTVWIHDGYCKAAISFTEDDAQAVADKLHSIARTLEGAIGVWTESENRLAWGDR